MKIPEIEFSSTNLGTIDGKQFRTMAMCGFPSSWTFGYPSMNHNHIFNYKLTLTVIIKNGSNGS
jgi:hypothetical protein